MKKQTKQNKSIPFFAGVFFGMLLFNIYLTLKVEQKVISPVVKEVTIQKPVEPRPEKG